MKIRFLQFCSIGLLGLCFSFQSHGQTTVNFEIDLPAAGFYNGSDGAGGFTSGPLYFKNIYDSQFNFWQGFACSSKNDTTTAGFSNQYSAFAGSGAGGSSKFGLGYVIEDIWLKKSSPFSGPFTLNSLAYTNSTFAALSMRNGDAFSKKFGGQSGNDPDFFKLKIYNHYNGSVTDSAEVFLADFRFSDNSQDYIVKNWRTVELNFSNPFDSIQFKLESSDNGQFGMNTPAYFCLDNLILGDFTSVAQSSLSKKALYPNPAHDFVHLPFISEDDLTLVDALGKSYKVASQTSHQETLLDLSALPSGMYRLFSKGMSLGSFIKR